MLLWIAVVVFILAISNLWRTVDFNAHISDHGNSNLVSIFGHFSPARVFVDCCLFFTITALLFQMIGPISNSITPIRRFETSLIRDGDTLSNSCTICLEQYTIAEFVRILPCGHAYHPHCVVQWFEAQRSMGRAGNCPMCRGPFNIDITTLAELDATAREIVVQYFILQATVFLTVNWWSRIRILSWPMGILSTVNSINFCHQVIMTILELRRRSDRFDRIRGIKGSAFSIRSPVCRRQIAVIWCAIASIGIGLLCFMLMMFFMFY